MSGNWLDLSSSSNRYIQTYMKGFLDMSGGNLLLRNNNIIVNSGDISLNGRIFVSNDASLSGRLFVSKDLSLNSRLFVGGDVSMNGNVYARGTIITDASSYTDVKGGFIVENNVNVTGIINQSTLNLSGGYIYLPSNVTTEQYNNLVSSLTAVNNVIQTTNVAAVSSYGGGTVTRVGLPPYAGGPNIITQTMADNWVSGNLLVAGSTNINTNQVTGGPGSLYVAGSVNVPNGNLVVGGNVSLLNNTLNMALGNITLTGGNVTLNNGYIQTSGNIMTTNGTVHSANDISVNGLVFGKGPGGNNIVLGSTLLTSANVYTINNLALGKNSLTSISNNSNVTYGAFGSNNTTVGFSAGSGVTYGNYNTAVGSNSGSSLTTGNSNTFLGGNTTTSSGAYAQSTAVGFGATIGGSNQVVLGTATESVIVAGNVGIGRTGVPTYSLDVSGTINARGEIISSGCYFSQQYTYTTTGAGTVYLKIGSIWGNFTEHVLTQYSTGYVGNLRIIVDCAQQGGGALANTPIQLISSTGSANSCVITNVFIVQPVAGGIGTVGELWIQVTTASSNQIIVHSWRSMASTNHASNQGTAIGTQTSTAMPPLITTTSPATTTDYVVVATYTPNSALGSGGSTAFMGQKVGVGVAAPAYPLDVSGVIRSSNLPKYWNYYRLYGSAALSQLASPCYFLLGTLADAGNAANGGSMCINGGIGGWIYNQKTNVNITLSTRGMSSTTIGVTGSINSSSITLANLLVMCDIVVYYNSGTYSVYLLVKVSGAGQFPWFDFTVTGNDQNSNSCNLAEPAQGTTTTPSGSLLSGTPSVLSALQSYNINGNLGIGQSAPTYNLDVTGTARFTSDVSINGNLVVGNLLVRGGLTVQQLQNQNIINTTTSNYQLIVTEDLSMNGRLFVSSDASFGGNLTVSPSKIVTVGGGDDGSTPTSGLLRIGMSHQTGTVLQIQKTGVTSWGTSTRYDATRYINCTSNADTSKDFNVGPGGVGIGYAPPLYSRGGADGLYVNGNVGIGTTNPSGQLHVFRGGAGTIATLAGNGGGGNQYNLDLCSYINPSGIPTNRISVIDDGAYSGHITFSSKTAGSENNTINEWMRIKSNGFVGINKTAPGYQLDVSGTIMASGYNPQNIGIATTAVPRAGSLIMVDATAGAFTNQLGTTAGNYLPIINTTYVNGNTSYFNTYAYRWASGNNWTTASTRIGQSIDTTNQAYIEFNPPAQNYGLGLYAGGNGGLLTPLSYSGLTIANGGNAGFNNPQPMYRLDVNGTSRLNNSLTFTGSVTGTISPNTTGATASAWAAGGINYVASASTSTMAPYFAFDTVYTLNNKWIGGGGTNPNYIYSSTTGLATSFAATTVVVGQTDICGEWIQIQNSQQLVLNNYNIASSDVTLRNPKSFWIVGSNDGSTFFPIQYCTIATNPYTANSALAGTFVAGTTGTQNGYTTTAYTNYSGNAYYYHRMLITATFNDTITPGSVALGEWIINYNKPSTVTLALDGTTSGQLNITGGIKTDVQNPSVSYAITGKSPILVNGGSANNYTILKFTETGTSTITPTVNMTVGYIVVGGGGGGGSTPSIDGWPGAGGGTVYGTYANPITLAAGTSYTITVGAGGAGGTGGNVGSSGSNSSIVGGSITITATGGGAATGNGTGSSAPTVGGAGTISGVTGYTTLSGQGMTNGYHSDGSPGRAFTDTYLNQIFQFGAGGGGANNYYGGSGGGGMGALTASSVSHALAGSPNTGSGGGAGGAVYIGAAGGSGIVILYFLNNQSVSLTNSNVSGMIVSPNTSTLNNNANLVSSHTWVNNSITWLATASSSYRQDYSAYSVFNSVSSGMVWDALTSGYSNTVGGAYTANTYSTAVGLPLSSTLYGEWIQIQSSVPLVMKNYQLGSGDATGRSIRVFTIVGSTDGSNWFPIQQGTIAANPYSAAQTLVSTVVSATTAVSASTFGSSTITTTVYSTTTNAYTHFRMIITSIVGGYGDGTASCGEWLINFNPSSCGVSLALDSTTPNQLNIGGSVNIGGNMSIPGLLSLGGGYSATQNGYTYLPGGILLQWGTFNNVTIPTSNGTVFSKAFSFNRSFTRQCWYIGFTSSDQSPGAGGNGYVVAAGSITTVGATMNLSVVINGATGYNAGLTANYPIFYWLAIGM